MSFAEMITIRQSGSRAGTIVEEFCQAVEANTL
jgi:hypothetical protein